MDFLLHSVECEARETADSFTLRQAIKGLAGLHCDLQCGSNIGYACSGVPLECMCSEAVALRVRTFCNSGRAF